MKVSIIVPVYNGQEYIEQCINSIINQTYTNLEIIVINDGSIDNTINILKYFETKDSRIRIIDKENTGVSDSRNIGIIESTGQYISFADADDWLELNMIEELVDRMQEENVDAVRCNYYRQYDRKIKETKYVSNLYGLENKYIKKEQMKENVLDKILDGRLPAYLWLLLVKSDIAKKIKPLNTNLAMMEDTVYFIELLINLNNIYIYDAPLYNYYYNKESASKSEKNYIRNYENVLLVNEIINNILEENKINTIKRKEIYNTAHLKYIEYICYKTCKINQEKNKLKNSLVKIVENPKVREIIFNSEISNTKIQIKMALKLMKSKKVKTLMKYYELKNILAIIKTIITRRKEF